jgi:hypothetical protein
MSQYIIHAAPYSSPNSSKRIKSNWAVQNLKVFQENPNAGGGVFAKFDLVNTSNPKDKKYMMQFSFADTTSMTSNAINRIRKFFDAAYDRQRNSSYGFPQLSDTEKTQIVARINTAYNQFAGFSHSSEDADIIDCRHSYIEHKASTAAIYSRRYGPNNEGIITLQRDRGGIHDFVVTLKNNGSTGQFYVRDTSHKPDIERSLNLLANTPKVSKCIEKDEVSNMAGTILVLRQEAMDFGKNQHEGYYSPNLQHSEPDYLSVKMSAIDDLDDNYLEHHGILGMKWGIRRYQNSDGSLTPEGKIRYGSQMAKALQKGDQKSYDKIRSKIKEGSDNDLLEKVANQLNDSGKKASKKNYSDALKKTEAEALENKRKEYARVVKEKVESGKNGGSDAGLYAEYHDNLYDEEKFHGKRTTEEEYKKNGYMSNAERQTFNYAEKECQKLSDDKKDAFLRGISATFDGSVRDDPSVLVWDNKKNKIVAYPSAYEFERIPDFDKYRNAWTSGNTIWLYTWGEQYDG